MQETITLRLSQKRLMGKSLKVFFCDENDKRKKVLKFTNVIAFVDTPYEQAEKYILQVREGMSVYGLDMSMQLKMPGVENYPETFLFVNEVGPDFTLRVLSEKVEWRDFDDTAYGDMNF